MSTAPVRVKVNGVGVRAREKRERERRGGGRVGLFLASASLHDEVAHDKDPEGS